MTYPVESTSFYNGITEQLTHVFVWPERPLTVNVAIRSHHRVVSAFTREYREAFRLMSVGCDKLASCDIVVDQLVADRRYPDCAAAALAVKAALDGIVLAGVLEDDGPRFVKSILFNAPVNAGIDCLILTLKGDAA